MEKAILVTVNLAKREGWTAQDKADELRELAVSAGAKVVGELIVNMKAPHSACFIGSGKAEEIAALCASKGANAVIFLLSEEGAYITGKVLQVDGGQFIGG